MGKKTLYNPVSLHVLRGALEYCGIKLGRLVQIGGSPSLETATYRATIVQIPQAMRSFLPSQLANELQECFARDVQILSVRSEYDVKRKKSALTAILFVDIHEQALMEALLEEKSNE